MSEQNQQAGTGPVERPGRPVAEALRTAVARTTRVNAEVALLCEAALRGAAEIDQADKMRAALAEILVIVSLHREPHWSYRNTITTNRDRIKAACLRALGPNVGGEA